MKWELKEIKIGDIVRVPMSEFYHYGVCTGEDRIVQFGEPVLSSRIPRDEIRVIATDISSFLSGAFAEVAVFDRKENKRKKSVAEIVEYAERSIGKGGYDILYNNCEHFANECVFGVHASSHVDDVRKEVEKKLPLINVYIGSVSDFLNDDNLPSYVRKDLKKIKNERVAAEKISGYCLLDFAIKKSGENFNVKKCFLGKTGKPLHKNFCFSISHSCGAVAVAISSSPVGIDIEERENEKICSKIESKFLHPNDTISDRLALWTVKEAVFKFCGTQENFVPSDIDTSKYKTRSVTFEYLGKSYVVSVASDVILRVNYFSAPDFRAIDVNEC